MQWPNLYFLSDFLSSMFLSFLSCSLFSYAANPRAVIVKCDGCAYDVDVDVDVDYCVFWKGNVHVMRRQNHAAMFKIIA